MTRYAVEIPDHADKNVAEAYMTNTISTATTILNIVGSDVPTTCSRGARGRAQRVAAEYATLARVLGKCGGT